MSTLLVAGAGGVLAGVLAVLVTLRLARGRGRLAPGPKRVLFPFVGSALAESALDAALRIARADQATLVPAYLASVPLHLPLEAALPRQCEVALPLLEAIEQRAYRARVPVDTRIEPGRNHRHALRRLIEHETFDRIVMPASTAGLTGFSSEDVAWLLRRAPGEIVVLRAGDHVPSLPAAPRDDRAPGRPSP